MAEENIIISTDCICDLPKEIVDKYHIQLMYFYIYTEEARFQDIFEMTSDNLIEYIDEDNKNAHSGCASVKEYLAYFRELQNGTDKEIIYIATSKYVSEAYENALAAAEQMEYVYVVDSGHLSGGLGLLVIAAAEMALCGAPAELIIEEVTNMSKRISTSFIVDSVESLYRNGRITKAAYMICKTLSLHPILKMKNGKLLLVGICMGRTYRFARTYIKWVLKNREDIVTDRAFLISAGCSYEYKNFLKKEVISRVSWDKFVLNDASATVSSNCGPGCFGVLFERKKN